MCNDFPRGPRCQPLRQRVVVSAAPLAQFAPTERHPGLPDRSHDAGPHRVGVVPGCAIVPVTAVIAGREVGARRLSRPPLRQPRRMIAVLDRTDRPDQIQVVRPSQQQAKPLCLLFELTHSRAPFVTGCGMDILEARVEPDFEFDLAGRVRNLSLPASPVNALIPLFEAISNALHAVEARWEDQTTSSGKIEIEMHRRDGVEAGSVQGFTVRDNGIGLNDANWRSDVRSQGILARDIARIRRREHRGRVGEEAGPMDVGDHALIRGLGTASPLVRPGASRSYCGRRRGRPQSVDGSSPAVAPPPPLRSPMAGERGSVRYAVGIGFTSRPIAQTKPASSRATAVTATVSCLPRPPARDSARTAGSAPSTRCP